MIASSLSSGKNHQVPEWRRVGRGLGPGAASWTWSPDPRLGGEQVRGEGSCILERTQNAGLWEVRKVEVSRKQDYRSGI